MPFFIHLGIRHGRATARRQLSHNPIRSRNDFVTRLRRPQPSPMFVIRGTTPLNRVYLSATVPRKKPRSIPRKVEAPLTGEQRSINPDIVFEHFEALQKFGADHFLLIDIRFLHE
jgi:hypothetical protein